jgi:serine O-acetyltransferase
MYQGVVGSSVWLTKSVEPHTTVVLESPRLRVKNEGLGDLEPTLNYVI